MSKKIESALISVFSKEGLEPLLEVLKKNHVKIYSTGGTYDYLIQHGYEATTVESITSYPSILGGRVKTLHPTVFGGILNRRNLEQDKKDCQQYQIPPIDMVVVDLYPFQKTLASGADHSSIIEKIDIGGISLIRAAAKNYQDVLIVSSVSQYEKVTALLKEKKASTDLEDREYYALQAFRESSSYDTAIAQYFQSISGATQPKGREAIQNLSNQVCALGERPLRYGENPHQKGSFFGNMDSCFTQLHGKEISYNNLLDIDAAIHLIRDFSTTTFAILKHNNACGLASRKTVLESYQDALAGDPVSAFGGVLICNAPIDLATAEAMNTLFFEVLLAPGFAEEALPVLRSKKNRILLQLHDFAVPGFQVKSCLNGLLLQDRDLAVEKPENLKLVTKTAVPDSQIEDLLFANKIVKHSKSNAIVIAKNHQLIASGVGQTSRVDALEQAIAKAKHFNFDLNGAVVASDAFFPFADCVSIASKEGIQSFIQPGGSIRDQESIDFCDEHHLSMVFTGIRHFKH